MEGIILNYLIDKNMKVNFSPKNEVEEILQNIRTILSTIKGSVPLDREFGIDASYLDAPTPVAKAMLSSEILQAVRKYEPRAEITKIEFEGDLNGVLKPRIEVRIND